MTDLSIMNSCKTITDAINENEYEPEIYEDTVAFSAPMAQTSFGKNLKSPYNTLYENDLRLIKTSIQQLNLQALLELRLALKTG